MAAAVARAVARAGAGRGGPAAAARWGPGAAAAAAGAAGSASVALPRRLALGGARSWALPPSGGGSGLQRALAAAASAAPGGDGGLSEVLQAELQACRDDYQESPLLTAGPEGFQITEASGDAKVTLRRALGDEDISVVFDCIQEGEEFLDEVDEDDDFPFEDAEADAEPARGRLDGTGAEGDEEGYEEGDDDFEGMEFVDFNVHVRKGDFELVFECLADIGGFQINQVRMEGAAFAVAEAEGVPYPGPEFNTLDEELQEAFVEFLEARGVNSSMGAWIVVKASDKEDREYATWLENVAAFVKD